MHLILLAIGGTLLTLGDIVFKTWATANAPYLSYQYILGLALYIAGLLCLIETFRTQNIAVATAVFVLINIATLALVSWFWFGEKLSLLQVAGLVCAAAAVLLLELGVVHT
jgi:multidrug transporter EmrE-like cation transporter